MNGSFFRVQDAVVDLGRRAGRLLGAAAERRLRRAEAVHVAEGLKRIPKDSKEETFKLFL